MDLGPPQRLVGVDVADSGHHLLIQQLTFELRALAPQHADDGLGVEAGVQRVTGQVRDRRRHHAAVDLHQVGEQPPTDGALVGEAQHGPVVEQRGDPHVLGARGGAQQHLPDV